MILSKLFMGKIISALSKHFRLDTIMSYVFDDNELDHKTKNLNDRVSILESLAHPKREFVVCDKCNKKIKEK